MTAKTERRTTRPWMGLVDGRFVEEDRRLEDWNNIVVGTSGTPWLYEPRGPFQYQTCSETGAYDQTGHFVFDTLAEAVNEFARWELPPRRGHLASIIDETYRIVLMASWITQDAGDGLSPWDIGGCWWGIKATFDEMRRQSVCDDVSIAVWEVRAMEYAPGGHE